MSEKRAEFLRYMQDHEAEIMGDLTELVLAESATYSRDKVLHCGEVLKSIVKKRLGLEPVQEYPQEQFGNHIYYELGEGTSRIMCIGHYDTVWEKNAPDFRTEGNELHGPGVYDMKAGIITMIWALKACRDLGVRLRHRVGMFFNCDEEMGSFTSKSIIWERAKGCRCCFVLEPSSAVGAVTTARKGCSDYVVNIYGRASHAGAAHAEGRNAIAEMARLVTYLESLTNYDLGTTFNVGVCSGGSRACIVPDFATFTVNCRYTSMEERQRCYDIVYGLRPSREGIRVEAHGEMGQPPLLETPENAELYQLVREAGAAFGLDIGKQFGGGTSNANDVAMVNVPVIDGMGPAGRGAHASDECIYLDQFLPRIAMFTAVLEKI